MCIFSRGRQTYGYNFQGLFQGSNPQNTSGEANGNLHPHISRFLVCLLCVTHNNTWWIYSLWNYMGTLLTCNNCCSASTGSATHCFSPTSIGTLCQSKSFFCFGALGWIGLLLYNLQIAFLTCDRKLQLHPETCVKPFVFAGHCLTSFIIHLIVFPCIYFSWHKAYPNSNFWCMQMTNAGFFQW